MAELRLRGLRKAYAGGPEVLRGVDLDIAAGEFMVFVGASGCGKSTLLRLIAGLEPHDAGTLHIAGADMAGVPAAARGVAMVFQSYALYPHLTVAQNLGFALKMAGTPRAEVTRRVGEAAEILHIAELLPRKPRELSGGQRQRVAIGRAIVRRPRVFLFDEPLSNLDAGLRVQMRIELARLHRELRTTMVYVTHDQVEAMTLGQRIALFNAGRIEQVGAPLALFEQPRNRYVAGFLGTPRMNLVDCEPGDGAALRCAGARLALAAPAPAARTLGVRPEHLALAAPGRGLPARVMFVEHLGDAVIVHAELDGQAGTVALRLDPADPCPAPGDAVGLCPDPARLHLFDADGLAIARPTADPTARAA